MKELISCFLNSIPSGMEGEIYVVHRREKYAEAGSGRIEKSQEAETIETAIRLKSDSRVSFGFVTDPSREKIEKLIKTTVEKIEYQKERPHFSFPDPENPGEVTGICDPSFEKVELAELEALALEMESSARKDSRIVATRNVKVEAEYERIWIANSRGVDYSSDRTLFSNELMVVAEEGGETGDSWDFSISHLFSGLENIAERTAEKALKSIGGKPPETGRYTLIVENRMASFLLSSIFQGFTGESVYKGRSPLVNKVGKKIFSEKLNITVNGRLPQSPLAFPFDGEGVVTDRVEIVKNGVLLNLILDMEYARIFKDRPTGSVVRSDLKNPPSTGEMNFFIEPSNISPEDLAGGVEKGLFITELMGLHTIDPITWQFSLGARGFLIEKGKVTSPVQQFTVSGTLSELFRRIEVASDLKFTGGTGAPSILFEGVSVGGK